MMFYARLELSLRDQMMTMRHSQYLRGKNSNDSNEICKEIFKAKEPHFLKKMKIYICKWALFQPKRLFHISV